MAFFLLVFLQSSVLRLLAFFSNDVIVVKKVPVEKESELSMGGAITFLALFHQNHIHCQQHRQNALRAVERVDLLSLYLAGALILILCIV